MKSIKFNNLPPIPVNLTEKNLETLRKNIADRAKRLEEKALKAKNPGQKVKYLHQLVELKSLYDMVFGKEKQQIERTGKENETDKKQ